MNIYFAAVQGKVAIPFPVKVVVVSDGGNFCLGDDVGQGKAQWYVHGNRQSIFNHQKFNLEHIDEQFQARSNGGFVVAYDPGQPQ